MCPREPPWLGPRGASAPPVGFRGLGGYRDDQRPLPSSSSVATTGNRPTNSGIEPNFKNSVYVKPRSLDKADRSALVSF